MTLSSRDLHVFANSSAKRSEVRPVSSSGGTKRYAQKRAWARAAETREKLGLHAERPAYKWDWKRLNREGFSVIFQRRSADWRDS